MGLNSKVGVPTDHLLASNYVGGLLLCVSSRATASICCPSSFELTPRLRSGSPIGLGIVFGSLIHSVSRNPSLSKQLFGYAILGFALSEAMALFALLVAFLILFGLIGFVGCMG